jgi:hypothetical protein
MLAATPTAWSVKRFHCGEIPVVEDHALLDPDTTLQVDNEKRTRTTSAIDVARARRTILQKMAKTLM